MADAAKEEIQRLLRQRRVLCAFGEDVLRAESIDTVLHHACAAVSDAVDVQLVKGLEWLQDEGKMLVRAGVGWAPGVVGTVKLDADVGSPGGYALKTSEPVISPDVTTERRFAIPPLLVDHGVRSMVNVAIPTRAGPWGVLEVDSPRGRSFGDDDVLFLKNYANLVGAAIERIESDVQRSGAHEQTRTLLREMQHRVMNLLGNVRALAALTGRQSETVDEFVAAFDTRLGALMRTQALLTRGTMADIDLRELLCQELEAHGARDDTRVFLTGPPVALTPSVARPLAMAFHELATNAVKHGALRHKGGRIEIVWAVAPEAPGGDDPDPDPELSIRWSETGLRLAGPPERRSLGMRMLDSGVPTMADGTAEFAFRPEGIEYVLRLPLPR